MNPDSVQLLTSAVAPVVMVSAAGLLFMGMQAKNLHLADRVRALTAESRALPPDPTHEPRRRQIADQVVMFRRRLVLSQRALECIFLSIVCFVVTSLLLLLASVAMPIVATHAVVAIFLLGVILLLAALALEFLEMRVGLHTIEIETSDLQRR
jgi:hypothetical protein